jgi:hypothetical protein
MNEITWLSHGGPGSGRYPKGSGKNPRSEIRKKIRASNKIRKKNAVNTYYINKKEGRIERTQYKIKKYKYKGKDPTKLKKYEEGLQSDLKKMKAYSVDNVKRYKEIDNFIKKEFNIPLREVRRQKITGIKPAILLDTGNMLVAGVSPAWQQYKKVKKSKF